MEKFSFSLEKKWRNLVFLLKKLEVQKIIGSMLSPLLVAVVMDVITENARRGVDNELLYADDLILVSDLVFMIPADFEPAKKRSGQTRS